VRPWASYPGRSYELAMRLTDANDAIRARNLTASEVGALLDPHPYATPASIWDRLCNPFRLEVVPNEAMDTGLQMEHAILRLAEKRLGLRARANGKTYQHRSARLCATPDALVLGTPPGLIECKLSGRNEVWRSVPAHVDWQVRAQMACTGRHTAAVCVLVGAGLRTFLIEWDRAREDRLIEAVDSFWTNHVVPLVRPVPAVPADSLGYI
jgi:predicted phage-related endonuclease